MLLSNVVLQLLFPWLFVITSSLIRVFVIVPIISFVVFRCILIFLMLLLLCCRCTTILLVWLSFQVTTILATSPLLIL